jgi:hypothetical protein
MECRAATGHLASATRTCITERDWSCSVQLWSHLRPCQSFSRIRHSYVHTNDAAPGWPVLRGTDAEHRSRGPRPSLHHHSPASRACDGSQRGGRQHDHSSHCTDRCWTEPWRANCGQQPDSASRHNYCPGTSSRSERGTGLSGQCGRLRRPAATNSHRSQRGWSKCRNCCHNTGRGRAGAWDRNVCEQHNVRGWHHFVAKSPRWFNCNTRFASQRGGLSWSACARARCGWVCAGSCVADTGGVWAGFGFARDCEQYNSSCWHRDQSESNSRTECFGKYRCQCRCLKWSSCARARYCRHHSGRCHNNADKRRTAAWQPDI